MIILSRCVPAGGGFVRAVDKAAILSGKGGKETTPLFCFSNGKFRLIGEELLQKLPPS